MTDEPRPTGLIKTVCQRARFYDAVLLVSVPIVLVAVYVSPAEFRRSLVFKYTDPSLSTAFASAFVHFDRLHLFVNLATYAVVVSVVFALAVVSGYRQQFYVVFFNFVLVLPALLSYLNLAVLRSSIGFGFSGVVMAFAGYLPLSLAEYVEDQFDIGPRTAVAPMLFFLTLSLIAVLSVQPIVAENTTVFLGTSGLVAATLLSALLYAVSISSQGPGLAQKLRPAAGNTGYFELGIAALVLMFGLPFVAFPTVPELAESAINLYIHLLGYALGFLTTYVVTALEFRVTD